MRALVVMAMLGCGRIDFQLVAGSGDGGLAPCTSSVCSCNVDSDCTAAHTYCDAHGGEHTCDCVAGYAEQGGACQWVGVVVDPGFMDPSAWITSGTIVSAQTVAGQLDPGIANLALLQRVRQIVTMPRLSRAELLVLELSSAAYHGEGESDSASVAVAGLWWDFDGYLAYNVQRRCLGAAQYAPESSSGAGVPVTLELMPTWSAMFVGIDHVEIKPAMPGECAVPGPVADGDAETDGRWQFSAPMDGSFAGFADGAGAGGSRAARLYAANYCGRSTLSLPVSVPTASDMPSPALSFWMSGSAGAVISVQGLYTGSGPTLGVNGTGSAHTVVACLPPSSRGRADIFGVTESAVGTCTNPLGWDTAIDNLALVNEPACGTDPGITDPGFESQLLPVGCTADPTGTVNSARIATGAGEPHSGAAALRLGTTQTCQPVTYNVSFVQPPSSTAGGPALAFYYRATASNYYGFAALATSTTATVVLDGAWHRGVVCLDPMLSGRNQYVIIGMQIVNSVCGINIAEEYAYLDDLVATNDPGCPQ